MLLIYLLWTYWSAILRLHFGKLWGDFRFQPGGKEDKSSIEPHVYDSQMETQSVTLCVSFILHLWW